MGISINDQELEAAMAAVAAIAQPHLRAEVSRLNKAVGDEETPPGDEGAGGPPPEASAGGPPEASAGGPPGADAGGPPPPGPDAAPPADGGGGDGFPTDPAELEQLVSQLAPEQQQALYLALKKVMHRAAGAGAPPAGPPAGPPEASAGGPPPTMKNEPKASKANGGQIAKNQTQESTMKKNEIEALVSERLSKLEDNVVAALTKIVGTPMRKSFQGVSQVVPAIKTEELPAVTLSKSEIDARLKDMIRGQKLAKSDKNKVMAYYNSGAKDVSGIAHLLKD